MVKNNDKKEFLFVAIIGIVAIVVLFLAFLSNAPNTGEDLTGQAFASRFNQEQKVTKGTDISSKEIIGVIENSNTPVSTQNHLKDFVEEYSIINPGVAWSWGFDPQGSFWVCIEEWQWCWTSGYIEDP